MKEIGKQAFEYSGLKTVTMGSGLTDIGEYAFRKCTSLYLINLPDNILKIETGCFEGCSALARITLPARMTNIGNSAFRDCTALKTVDIPITLHGVDYYAFLGCSALKKINYPGEPTYFASIMINNGNDELLLAYFGGIEE